MSFNLKELLLDKFKRPIPQLWDEVKQEFVPYTPTVASGSGGSSSSASSYVAKEPFSGSATMTKTFSSPMSGLAISNDGTSDLTFTIGTDTYTVKTGEGFEALFDSFTQVTINTTVPFRAYGKKSNVVVAPDTTAPSEVTNLTTSNITATSLTLSWTASLSTDVSGYEVYNGTTLLSTVTGVTYNVSSLIASTAYTFTVKVKDTSNNVSTGVSVNATTTNVADTTAPNNVTNLVSSNITQTGATLTWTASTSTDVANYQIYNGTTNIGQASVNEFIISGLTAGTAYTFTVKAKDASLNESSGTSVNVTTTSVDTTAPVLTITPTASFTTSQTVTMTTNETATIYYTLDGTTPTTSSLVYSTALSLSATTTVKAFAKDTAGNESTVQTVTYTKETVAIPDGAIVYSTFDGVDSTTSLGTANTSQTWEVLVGTWGINSNKAYLASGTNGIAAIDAGISDIDISTDITWGSEATLTLRVKDSGNFLFLRLKSGQVQFYEMVNSVGTLINSVNTTLTSGQVYTLRATLRGSTITCYLNGIEVMKTYSVLYTTATKFGFRQSATTTDRYDNFTIKQLPSVILTDYVAYESFDRANSTTSLGIAETNQTWEQLVDTWGIVDKVSYVSNDSNVVSISDAIAVVETSISNAEIEVVCSISANSGIAFRASNADNYLYFRYSPGVGEWQLLKFVTGGGYTKIGFVSETNLTGKSHKLSVTFNGSSIQCFANGVSKITTTETFNETATKHGIAAIFGNAKFDNFAVKNISV